MTLAQRVLLLGQLAGARNEHGWFEVRQINWLNEALRLPVISNPSHFLRQLLDQRLLTKRELAPQWTLTPVGRQSAYELVADFDYSLIQGELNMLVGSEFASVRHHVIPPSLAPAQLQTGIGRLLEQFAFETNVFCMTRFPGTDTSGMPEALASRIQEMRFALKNHGMVMHLASDRQADDVLFGNIGAHMWASQYGIGVLEGRADNADWLNANVLIELGSMLFSGRRCVILKDRSVGKLPTDIAGLIYKSVDLESRESVDSAVHEWLAKDIGLGACKRCVDTVGAVTSQ